MNGLPIEIVKSYIFLGCILSFDSNDSLDFDWWKIFLICNLVIRIDNFILMDAIYIHYFNRFAAVFMYLFSG